jgi:hypothetical protein
MTYAVFKIVAKTILREQDRLLSSVLSSKPAENTSFTAQHTFLARGFLRALQYCW